MSITSIVFALAIGLPLAVAILRSGKAAAVAINSVNGLRTLPSLAILAIMMPLLGIGLWPSIVALTILALPPILINAYIGLRDVDADAIEAATGMGMSEQAGPAPHPHPAGGAGDVRGRCAPRRCRCWPARRSRPSSAAAGLAISSPPASRAWIMSRLLVGAVPIALLALGTEFLLGRTERVLFGERTAA